jgi:putative flippase GtrA
VNTHLPFRYLLVGGINTVFGYGVGVSLYSWLHPQFHILVIGLLANVAAISFSFTSYKLFVFRTRGNWPAEYLRSYLVYGGVALVGIVVLWALIDVLGMSIWLAQGVAIAVTVSVSYVGHSRHDGYK